MGVVVGLLEQEELDLAAALGDVPGRLRGVRLALKDPPRRDLHGSARVHVDEVDDHQRRAVEPWQVADRRLVDDAAHVAIALVVARPAEPGEWRVVEVAGDQVVTVLGALGKDRVDEEFTVRALADHPPVVVGEHGEHGVDGTALDVGAKLVDRDVKFLDIDVTPAWCRRR